MCGKEGVGFEPTGDLAATTRLANERNRPNSAIPPKRIKFRYSYYRLFFLRCQPRNRFFLLFFNKKNSFTILRHFFL